MGGKQISGPDEKKEIIDKGTTRLSATRITNTNKPDDNRVKGEIKVRTGLCEEHELELDDDNDHEHDDDCDHESDTES